jgi:hypothetical protein
MIDTDAYHMAMPMDREVLKTRGRISKWDFEMTDQQALISPSQALGFELDNKRWVRLDVELLQDIVWEEKDWDRLELESECKNDLKRLVEAHSSHPKGDQASAKGQGLMFLLHGLPGSGKTFTVGKFTALTIST